jgi:hypothetical protein
MALTPDWIGWLATATFLLSYSCKDQSKLRRTQAVAALMWAAYGTILHAVPIVVANLLVAGVAVYSSLSGSRTTRFLSTHSLDQGVRPAGEPGLSGTSSPYS